jgi:hypothetical protein
MAEKDAEHEVEWVDPDYTKKSFKDVNSESSTVEKKDESNSTGG